MANDVPTVEQLCLGRLPSGRTVDVLKTLDPEALPGLVDAFLRAQGVDLTGSESLVDYAKSKAIEDVEYVFDLADARAAAEPRRVGRPRNRAVGDIVLMAAFRKFASQGLGASMARQRAAHFLGSTSSKVEKGVRRFMLRTIALHVSCAMPLAEACRIQMSFVMTARGMLDDCAEQRRSMLAKSRRYSPKIASILARRTGAG